MFNDKSTYRYDVVTLGETMLRFTPPGRNRLEQASELQVHVGGSESNTIVGLARMGLRTAWISSLPNSALGRIVAGEIARHGVDVQHTLWKDDARMGLYFLEEGGPPRGSSVIYDRRDSAMSRMKPEDLPEDVFVDARFRAFHTTGITLAISDSARATAERAVCLAKASGALISFDVNYRAKLWSPAQAAQGCDAILQQADLVFLPDRDAQALFGVPAIEQPVAALRQLSALYPQAAWILTRGRIGSMALAQGEIYEQGIFGSDEVGRLGGGDAFSAGFLASYLDDRPRDHALTPPLSTEPARVRMALLWGAATSALKYSMPGDLPLVTRHEVAALAAAGGKSSGLLR